MSKVIQLTYAKTAYTDVEGPTELDTLFALCEDGTIWVKNCSFSHPAIENKWKPLDLPPSKVPAPNK